MQYTDEQIKLIVSNVAENSEGLEFLSILLDKLGAYDRGFNFQNPLMDTYNKAKREQGLWLLDLIRNSNFDKYIELQKRRSEQCNKK